MSDTQQVDMLKHRLHEARADRDRLAADLAHARAKAANARSDADALAAENRRLASLLEKLRPYLRHDDGCLSLCSCGNLGLPHPCDCGLADLLAEIGDEK